MTGSLNDRWLIDVVAVTEQEHAVGACTLEHLARQGIGLLGIVAAAMTFAECDAFAALAMVRPLNCDAGESEGVGVN